MSRIDEPMILSEQFFSAVLTDIAKSIVDISNDTASVGNGHNKLLADRTKEISAVRT